VATVVLVQCGCGNRLSVFMPKVKQWVAMGAPADLLDQARELDAQEASVGEVDLAMQGSQQLGTQFVDGGKVDEWTCSGCGRRGRLADALGGAKFTPEDIEAMRRDQVDED